MEQLKHGTGWLPDLPSHQDYTHEHSQIAPLMSKFNLRGKKVIPDKVDLRKWFSPIENQGMINSCCAHAGSALVEYYEKRAFGKFISPSRMFLYKVTKNLLKKSGNVGVFPRTTMEAMTLFGIPPEEFWPYVDDVKKIDNEPSAFCYAFAENFKAIKYFRLDSPTCRKEDLLKQVKLFIAHGFPAMFGFSIYRFIVLDKNVKKTGQIPYPGENDKIVAGHAVAAAGYNDKIEIPIRTEKNLSTKGAVLIRNSWGTDWGEEGYMWLPYKYITSGLTRDWWVLIKSSWIDTGQFGKI